MTSGERGLKHRFRDWRHRTCLCCDDIDDEAPAERPRPVAQLDGPGMAAKDGMTKEPKATLSAPNSSVHSEHNKPPTQMEVADESPSEEIDNSWTNAAELALGRPSLVPNSPVASEDSQPPTEAQNNDDGPSQGNGSDETDAVELVKALPPSPITLEDHSSHLWQKAYTQLREENPELIDHYEAVLKDDASIPQDTPLQSQLKAVAEAQKAKVENRQWKFQWFGEQQLVREKAEFILDLTNKWAGVVTVAMQHAPPFVSIPWAASTALIPLMMNEVKEHKGCIGGLETVAKITFSYQMAERTFLGDEVTRELYTECVMELYKGVLEYQALAIQYFGKSTLRRLGKNMAGSTQWTDGSANLAALDTQTRGSLQFLGQESQIDSLKQIRQMLDRQEHDVKALLQQLTLGRDEVARVTELISPISYESDHYNVRKKLGESHYSSGGWFLEHPDVRAWRAWEPGRRCLWLNGSMGTGKSSLTSILVEDLTKNPDGVVAFFYCSRNFNNFDEKGTLRSHHENILRSILAQVSISLDGTSVHPEVKQRFDRTPRRALVSLGLSDTECVELLSDVFSSAKTRFTIVIDALDECQDYNALLSALREATNGHDGVRLAFSSRRQVRVDDEECFPEANAVTIMSQNREDIARYLEIEIEKRRSNCGITPSQIGRLKKVLIERASGMFMWVKLELGRIMHELRPRRIKLADDIEPKLHALETSSHRDLEQLYSAYDGVYEQAIGYDDEPRRRSIVVRALRWVLCAFRALTLRELACAVSILEGGDVDGNVQEGLLLDWCSNLLVEDTTSILRLSHLSVKHYLESRKQVTGECFPGEHFQTEGFQAEVAHLQAALSCLYFATSPLYGAMGPGGCEVLQVKNVTVTKEFYVYVTEHWTMHCRPAPQTEELLALMDAFASRPGIKRERTASFPTSTARAEDEPEAGGEDLGASPFSTFFKLASEDLNEAHSFLSQHIARGANVDDQDTSGTTLLHLCARIRKPPLMKALLDASADANIQDQHGYAPLHVAAMHGFDSGIRQLLLGQAEKNIRNARGETPLHTAVMFNRTEAAETLLSASVDVLARDHQGNTALHLAAANGNELLVDMMLLMGYSPNVRNHCGDSALSLAIGLGGIGMVELLLHKHGAEITNVERSIAASLNHPEILATISKHDAAPLRDWPGAGSAGFEPAETDTRLYIIQFPSEDGPRRPCRNCNVARWIIASSRGSSFRYHPSATALHESAESGCPLCEFFSRELKEDHGTARPTGQLMITIEPSSTQGSRIDRKDKLMLCAGETVLLTYEICIDPESLGREPLPVLDWITGRAVNAAPTANTSLRTITDWINDCDINHPNCPHQTASPLPAQVIDVGSPGDDFIRLVHGNSRTEKYLYLSFIWDRDAPSPAELTKENFKDLWNGVPIDTLNDTYRDAISLMRQLGFRYLWFNALCITRRNEVAAYAEVELMGKYLQGAAFVIVAATDRDIGTGLFHTRRPPALEMEMLHYAAASHQTGTGLSAAPDTAREAARIYLRRPLQTAAEVLRQEILKEEWMVQEVLLARGLLIQGLDQLYYHCRTCLRSEGSTLVQSPFLKLQPRVDAGSLSTSLGMTSTPTHANNTKNTAGGNRSFFPWYTFMEMYSRIVQDEGIEAVGLVPLAWLALYFDAKSRFSEGLWEEDMRNGLMWHVDDPFSAAETQERAGPSWSWASAIGPIQYDLALGCRHESMPAEMEFRYSISSPSPKLAVRLLRFVDYIGLSKIHLEIDAMTVESTTPGFDKSQFICFFDSPSHELEWRAGASHLLVLVAPWEIGSRKDWSTARGLGLILTLDGHGRDTCDSSGWEDEFALWQAMASRRSSDRSSDGEANEEADGDADGSDWASSDWDSDEEDSDEEKSGREGRFYRAGTFLTASYHGGLDKWTRRKVSLA